MASLTCAGAEAGGKAQSAVMLGEEQSAEVSEPCSWENILHSARARRKHPNLSEYSVLLLMSPVPVSPSAGMLLYHLAHLCLSQPFKVCSIEDWVRTQETNQLSMLVGRDCDR